MTESLLNHNLTLLEKRFPEQLPDATAAANLAQSPWQGLPERCDQPTAAVMEAGGRSCFPYGQRSPETIVSHWVSALQLRPYTLLCGEGIGTGYHWWRLLRELPRNCWLILGESHRERWGQLLREVDLTPLLSDPRLLLHPIGANAPLPESLWRPALWTGLLRGIPYAPLNRLHHERDWKILSERVQGIESRRRHWRTATSLAAPLEANLLQNLPRALDHPGIDTLKGGYQGQAAFLIGAGPSLQGSLSLIRQFRNRSTLFCGNSSLAPLLAADIKPDFVVITDPYHFAELGLKDQPIPETTWLIAPPRVTSGCIEPFQGRWITLPDDTPIGRWLGLDERPGPDGEPWPEGGTVASTMLRVIHELGFEKCILCGQDFAFAEDGRTHDRGTLYEKQGRNRLDEEERQLLEVPGNTRAQVRTNTIYYGFSLYFSQLARRLRRPEIVNSSALGAAIPGIPYQPDAAIRKWLRRSSGSGNKTPTPTPPTVPVAPRDSMVQQARHTLTRLEAFLDEAHPTPSRDQGFSELLRSGLAESLSSQQEVFRALHFPNDILKQIDSLDQQIQHDAQTQHALFLHRELTALIARS